MNKSHFIQQLKQALNDQKLPAELWQGQSAQMPRTAAVLFPFYWKNEAPWVLLTQRHKDLKHHSGQVSFPGGAFESSDGHVRQTALRETEEEIGIKANQIDLLGHLDPLPSISGFEVTPFVGFVESGFEIDKQDEEVDRVFGVPFAFFQEQANRTKQFAKTPIGRKHYYIYQYNDDVIWGLTAQIIVQLVKRLEEQS